MTTDQVNYPRSCEFTHYVARGIAIKVRALFTWSPRGGAKVEELHYRYQGQDVTDLLQAWSKDHDASIRARVEAEYHDTDW